MTKLMMKVLVRTAAWYSRTAMTSILRMVGLRVGNAYEDIVQGWPGQLEMMHRAAGQKSGQKLVGVAARIDAQLLPVAEVDYTGYAGQIPQGRAGAVQPDTHGIRSVSILDGFQGAVQDFLALVDHEDEVAHFLGDGHVVRGENHRRPLAVEVEDGIAQHFQVDRIQAGEGLIEQDQLRFGDDAGNELHLLSHALGKGFNLLGG